MFLSPPASPVEIEYKNKYLMRKKNVKYHKKVTMYPRLTIPKKQSCNLQVKKTILLHIQQKVQKRFAFLKKMYILEAKLYFRSISKPSFSVNGSRNQTKILTFGKLFLAIISCFYLYFPILFFYSLYDRNPV